MCVCEVHMFLAIFYADSAITLTLQYVVQNTDLYSPTAPTLRTEKSYQASIMNTSQTA